MANKEEKKNTKLVIEKANLLNSSIEKNNGKTFELYVFSTRTDDFIVVRKRFFIMPMTTTIVNVSKGIKDESTKAIKRLMGKHIDIIRDTKNAEFTKGSVSFVTKSGETYKFNVFGGFFNLIKAGFFVI